MAMTAQVSLPALNRLKTGVCSTSMTLDLGCGAHKVLGSIGLDRAALPGVDVVANLETLPYPFADGAFGEVHLNHVLEHVNDPLKLLEEVWRICRAGATLHVRLPHFSSLYAWTDPTHKRAFTYQTFDYLSAESAWSYYSGSKFEILERRLIYLLPYPYPGEKWLRPLWPLAQLIERFANAHPFIAERFLCYWVGGFSELRATLRVAK
jgi:SAM-dependent methyltransferase